MMYHVLTMAVGALNTLLDTTIKFIIVSRDHFTSFLEDHLSSGEREIIIDDGNSLDINHYISLLELTKKTEIFDEKLTIY